MQEIRMMETSLSLQSDTLCDSESQISRKNTLTVQYDGHSKFSSASSTDISDFEERNTLRTPPTGYCKNCKRSRACCISLYIWIFLFFLSSFVALIVVGAVIILPYARAERFYVTKCTALYAVNVSVHSVRCSCGKRCKSSYRCIEVAVDYENADGNVLKAALREDESVIHRKCSYYPPCKSSRVANEQAVRQYEAKYGKPNQQYSCLYNPNNPSEVIRTRRFHLRHVIHGMVWSSLIFLLSLAILIFAIKKKGCDFL